METLADHRMIAVPIPERVCKHPIDGTDEYVIDRILLCSCGASIQLLPHAVVELVREDHVFRRNRGFSV